ncbi:MAG: tryptophan-rich sensory protein [Anaerolineae bacterium]|nr:tryptophan-rich sensory protein [Anaerolineae bacterium]
MLRKNSLLLIVLNIVATIGTIAYNALSQILPIGTATNAEIANRLPIYFFPANYTFSIWGLIYLGWIGFTIYQALPSQRTNPFVRAVGPWFFLGSLGNIGWLLLFQYEQFAASMIPIVWLLLTLGIIYVRLRRVDATASMADRILIFAPFSIYFAWAAVATVANTTYVLYAAGQRDLFGIAEATWGAIMLVVAGAITGSVAIFNRDIPYVAVIVWAFIGIMARYPNILAVYWTAAGVAALAALAVVIVSVFGWGQASARTARR